MTLAQRAVACKHWCWLGGMNVIHPAPSEGQTGYLFRIPQYGYQPEPGDYPDLGDPATLGCLMALVRDAYGAETWIILDDGSWSVWTRQDGRRICVSFGWSEAEALIKALELK